MKNLDILTKRVFVFSISIAIVFISMSLFVFSLLTISKSYANSPAKNINNPSSNEVVIGSYVIIGTGNDKIGDYAIGFDKSRTTGHRLLKFR